MSLARVIEIAHKHGVPVIVDAAAQLPPVENLWRYSQMGSDLVVFSGGKGLRGPQGTGLIVGRKDLVQKCALNGCPNHAIGRSMKTSKEDVVGLYAAVKRFVEVDHARELEEMEEKVRLALEAVEDIPQVTCRRDFPARLGQTYPRAVITLVSGFPAGRDEVLEALRKGTPRIELGPYEKDEASIYVNPLTLSKSDAIIVASRLRSVMLEYLQRSAEERSECRV